MTVSQISVFTESKPGHLVRVLRRMEAAGVNVRGYSVSDTGDYGIARFVVDKPEQATSALEAAGAAYTVTQVLCLKLADEPGELARVMGVLADCGVNISYSYSMISTYIIINVPDTEHVKEILADQPVEIISQDDITALNADR